MSTWKWAILSVATLALMITGCSQQAVNNREREKGMASKTIEEVLKSHTNAWMAVPGVVAVGIGEIEGKPCIRVYIVEKTDEIRKKIPLQVEGFRVVIEVSGEIWAREAEEDSTGQ